MASKSEWRVIVVEAAQKDFAKLDKGLQNIVFSHLNKIKIDPERMGKPLRGPLSGFKKEYFLNKSYRIVFRVKSSDKVVEIWAIGRRDKSEVYETLAKRIK
ncbi:MAG TPA: type II toxin-antitoxin system RelE/ParE family toxin [bacterium]|nr:type II toxin-antitoxin system RelE/ParE family toxin [bacterium]